MHKYALELRKLAYTVPNGMAEHDLLELSELMNIAANETPQKYKQPANTSAQGAPTDDDRMRSALRYLLRNLPSGGIQPIGR
jgi:hypothetical protein